ncbi:MAG TPA: SDR family NAD(P)-dependent oxidoreductase [Rubricoccaceae bacterium]|jgi:short-subunit dehydrogenase
MSSTMNLKGRTALVTGAASGIGRAVAVSLARRGCALALVDLNAAGLAETATLVRPYGVETSVHRLDVGDRDAVAALPDAVMAEHAGVDVLVNNAGVALGGAFEEVDEADFEWLFGINFWGVVRMTRAFLPLLRASSEARLVNVSSIYGIIAPAGQTAYAASKFAVRGFSMALRHELEGSTVGVTVVHPGGVATAIADAARVPKGTSVEDAARGRARANRLLTLAPEVAGETIVRGIERRQARVLIGSDAKAAAVIERLMPVTYWALIRQRMGR